MHYVHQVMWKLMTSHLNLIEQQNTDENPTNTAAS